MDYEHVNLMSVTQYANARGISRQYVLKCLSNDRIDLLPAVVSANKIGSTWTLNVDAKQLAALTNQ